jgi:glucan phosphoethanolaminetransferase (alkaline phosphatase superfamily)
LRRLSDEARVGFGRLAQVKSTTMTACCLPACLLFSNHASYKRRRHQHQQSLLATVI